MVEVLSYAFKQIKMESLKVEDLVPGEIYHCHEMLDDADGIQKDLEIVFKFKEHTDDKDRAHSHYYVSTITHVTESSDVTETFRKDSNNKGKIHECTPWITGRNCRPANLLEKQWLMRSVMEDKFTKKPIKMTEQFSPINKPQSELVVEDFYQGQMFVGEIDHAGSGYKPAKGKITLEGGQIFLCQDTAKGDTCSNRQGYNYSYGLIYYGKLQLDTTMHGVNVRNLQIQSKTPSFENATKILDLTWYANIVGLEDPADDRLMMNFTSDFEFVGFSKQTKGPIFKIKNTGQTEAYWYENVISKITEMGGMIKMISEQELLSHFDEKTLDSHIKEIFS